MLCNYELNNAFLIFSATKLTDDTVRICIIFPKSAFDDNTITNLGVEVKELIKNSVYNVSGQYPIVGDLAFVYGPNNSSTVYLYINSCVEFCYVLDCFNNGCRFFYSAFLHSLWLAYLKCACNFLPLNIM